MGAIGAALGTFLAAVISGSIYFMIAQKLFNKLEKYK